MTQIKSNKEIGTYVNELILDKFKKKRAFCKKYLEETGAEVTDDGIQKMANRITQITNGVKSIQIYDLPVFSKLLNVSCEQIISAGEVIVQRQSRATNYSVSFSNDSSEWESYVNNPDKPFLNADEYNKTLIDYALECGNYKLLKYLIDQKYIWFDCNSESDYIKTFGAGTSIQRRKLQDMDTDLFNELSCEDGLRTKLIALAADHDDLQTLTELRARENPQMYFKAHYLSASHPDFDSAYDENTVRHISKSSVRVLDYFTDEFEIRDVIKYKDGSSRSHTFVYPYYSALLDLLIGNKSKFTQTALKKAIDHNKKVLNRLKELINSLKSDPYFVNNYNKNLWVDYCKKELDYYENGDIISFRCMLSGLSPEGIITNIIHTKKTSKYPNINNLIKELNDLFEKIKNLKDTLKGGHV